MALLLHLTFERGARNKEQEKISMCELLHQGVPLLTVLGGGGIGKTFYRK